MKKKWMALAAALVLALMLVMPAACAIFETYSADEVFPYDVAVTRGEEGARDDWLAGFTTPSTELRRAYEEAKADGSFTGTYFEFLKDVGAENSGEKIQSALLSVVNIFAYFEPSKSGSSNKPYYVTGSGVIYDLDTSAGNALIVTNYHIVYSATSRGDEDITHISDDITLSLYGESFSARPIKAAFVGGSMMHDIAVLRVTGCDYLNASKGEVYARKVARGDSDSVGIGESVYAIGNADGAGMSVTRGVLSVDAEYIDIMASDDKTRIENLLVMRTDAAVNHGNSGGGLFNAAGELIGIVNARDESDGIVGFGYALPANFSLALAQNIIDSCAADPRNRGAAVARIGITFQAQDAQCAFDEETGKAFIEEKLVVKEVEYNGKADKAGVRDGDTLISATLSSVQGTVYFTRQHKVGTLFMKIRLGDTLTLTVSRGGKLMEIPFTFDSASDFKLYN